MQKRSWAAVPRIHVSPPKNHSLLAVHSPGLAASAAAAAAATAAFATATAETAGVDIDIDIGGTAAIGVAVGAAGLVQLVVLSAWLT